MGPTTCNDHAVPTSLPPSIPPASRSAEDTTPLVALHGFTQTGRSWGAVERALGETILAPDLPGHGSASDERPTNLDAAAASIADRTTPLLGDNPAWWIGYSLGGRVLLHLALARPELVRGLVLLSTTAGIDAGAERATRLAADGALADEILRDGIEQFLVRWTAQPLFATLTLSDHDRADRLRNTAEGLAASLRSCGTGTQMPLWDRLGELSMPTVVITGALDAKFGALGRRLTDALPNAVHEDLADAGHACHLEQPGAFANALRRGQQCLRE